MSGTVTYQQEENTGFTFSYASFTASAALEPSTSYVATATTGITDRAGNHLPGEVTWTFTTGPTGTGTWKPMSPTDSMVSPRGFWTGSDMLVWDAYCGCGGRYNPVTDTWRAMSAAGGPTDRLGETAVWTGSQLIVWGGELWEGGYKQSNTGWLYDALGDSWTAISTEGAPEGRTGHVAVWTGREMLIWGGRKGDPFVPIYLATGGRYVPEANSWAPMSTAEAPSGRLSPAAVWTETEMIVWGGLRHVPEGDYTVSGGGRYNPATNAWRPMTAVAEPSGRALHTAVWTGREMIVWGGYTLQLFGGVVEVNNGGLYDPVTDTWSPTPEDATTPRERWGHVAVWTGSEMIVWGGYVGGTCWSYPVYGGRYDPAAKTWQATTPTDAPAGRVAPAAAWTGSEMALWGGSGGATSGGRYTPGP